MLRVAAARIQREYSLCGCMYVDTCVRCNIYKHLSTGPAKILLNILTFDKTSDFILDNTVQT